MPKWNQSPRDTMCEIKGRGGGNIGRVSCHGTMTPVTPVKGEEEEGVLVRRDSDCKTARPIGLPRAQLTMRGSCFEQK